MSVMLLTAAENLKATGNHPLANYQIQKMSVGGGESPDDIVYNVFLTLFEVGNKACLLYLHVILYDSLEGKSLFA